VLGASGFVGSDLAGHLMHLGIETVGLSSKDIDLCRPEAVDTLAGIVAPTDPVVIVSAITPDRGRDVSTLMRNLMMGEHLSRFLVSGSCAHVVYISSDAVYADGVSPVRESSCRAPASLHGVMHLAREHMLTHAVRATGLPFLILRPSLLYGARDTHNGYGPNRFVRMARGDRKIALFGRGEEKRDHVYIRDLSRLIGLALLHGSVGALNVATGTSRSFLEVAQVVRGLIGDAVEIEYLPRATPAIHRHFDFSATLKAFPSFRYTSLEEGLAEVVRELGTGRDWATGRSGGGHDVRVREVAG